MIHLAGFGREHQIDTGPFAGGDVLVERTRVIFQIIRAIKLHRVDENGYRHRAAWTSKASGLADQRQMSLMQGSHGWHQTQRARQGLELFPQGLDFADDNHEKDATPAGRFSPAKSVRILYANENAGHPGRE